MCMSTRTEPLRWRQASSLSLTFRKFQISLGRVTPGSPTFGAGSATWAVPHDGADRLRLRLLRPSILVQPELVVTDDIGERQVANPLGLRTVTSPQATST